jgi:hypothetical protein
MLIYIALIIVLLIYIFFIINSIIWLKDKRTKNINDIIIKYIIYSDVVIFTSILLFILYLFYNNYYIKILYL